MSKGRKIGLYCLTIFYTIAGINHFVNPGFYKPIMPPWLPWHYPLIYGTGALEILLGLFLLPQQTRRTAAWGIIILLILIFPANIQMVLNYQREDHPYLWIAIIRLPLQLVLLWWAYNFTGEERIK